MKKLIQAEKFEYYCDTCEKNLCDHYYGVPIDIYFGYGHVLDGENYHFCNYQCLLRFIIDELKKQQQ